MTNYAVKFHEHLYVIKSRYRMANRTQKQTVHTWKLYLRSGQLHDPQPVPGNNDKYSG